MRDSRSLLGAGQYQAFARSSRSRHSRDHGLRRAADAGSRLLKQKAMIWLGIFDYCLLVASDLMNITRLIAECRFDGFAIQFALDADDFSAISRLRG